MNLALVLATTLQMQSAISIPVTFSPGASGLVLMANASGTARILNNSLEIKIDELAVSRSTGTNKIKFAAYRACLAYQQSGDAWDMAVCSKPKRPNIVLGPADKKAIMDVTLSIPTKGLPQLSNFWLVIELYASSGGRGIGTVYTFSRKDIFKEQPQETPEAGR